MNLVLDKLIVQQITRNFLLLLISISLVVGITACGTNTAGSENTEDTPEKITGDQAIEVLIEVIRDAGLAFPSVDSESAKAKASSDLSGLDYAGKDSSPKGLTQVRLWIGPDGHIIPKPAWQQANPNVCAEQGRFMRGAVKLLEFEVHPTYREVQANVIDVETGEIEESVQGESYLPPPNLDWFAHAMNDAWAKIESKIQIKDAVDPCGDRFKGLTLVFNSKIKEASAGSIVIEHVVAEVELSATEDGIYDGSGTLKYIEITSSIDGTCTFPDGTLKVRELIFGLDSGVPIDDTSLDIEYENAVAGGNCSATDSEYVPVWPFSFVSLHMDEWTTEDGMSFDGLVIRDWEAVPGNDKILARKVYERTETVDNGGGTSTSTENTMIEIQRLDSP